ncbi:MAG: outer membrane lipoprotein-sorting protein [Truepera sp.]|nr:outer membrane lipoprotein-sorting protein [Truepera sp.]
MKKPLFTLFTLLVGLALAQPLSTGLEVMQAVDSQPTPATSISTTTMVITSGSGQSLSRQMRVWSVTGEIDKQVVIFTAPADIKGSGLLTIENPDGPDENLLYLPALGRVRRLAAAEQTTGSFFGSDFTYDDLGGTDITEFDYELLETTDTTYLVRGTPREGVVKAFDYSISEIDRERLMPLRVEFFKDGELYKVLTIHEISEEGSYITPVNLQMENVVTGSFTTIEIADTIYDEPIPDEVFSERFLTR